MRVDDFIADSDYILLQVHGGMDGVTLGVEGNSQRMRDLVGKGAADDDIKEAVTRGLRAGIRKFKFFMISALPGEDEGDIYRILRLAKELADIRDGMGQPNVRLQFSWTPLLIEAGTPFQWFAVPAASRAQGDVWEEFRELKVEFKLGGKAEPNKATFFQLCQRASREIGEIIVDCAESINKACWGGVPRHVKQDLDDRLKAAGFHNGIKDAYDERFKHDLFGWEFIDQGVAPELLWVTYYQMREFVEQTDSHTYDLNFDDSYHGNEWIERCDTRCYGKTCGTCDAEDLKIRRGYIQAAQTEHDVDLSTIKVVDQRSQAVKVRARIVKDEAYRFVMNDHWRYHVRRALFRAAFNLGVSYSVAKRTIRFASDDRNYRDWSCGVDYLEFALTERINREQLDALVAAVNVECRGLQLEKAWLFPGTAANMRTDIDLNLFELEVDEEPAVLLSKLAVWDRADYVLMVLRQEGGYFAPEREEVNAKDYCEQVWLIRDGHRLKVRMMTRGRASPYNIYAALTGKASWIAAAEKPAIQLDAFLEVDSDQEDFFRPTCLECGKLIPVNVMDEPWDEDRCPKCKDEADGRTVKEVVYA